MRILLLTHRFFPKYRAGTEVLTLQLATGLTARGHDVTVLAGEHDETLSVDTPPSLTNDVYEGIRTYRLHYGKAEQAWRHQGGSGKLAVAARLIANDLNPVALHVDAPARVAMVRELVTRLKPDVVHVNHVIGFSAAVIPAIRQLGIPVLFTPTDYFAVCPTDQLLHRFDHAVCEGPGDAVDCVRCLQPMPRLAAALAMTAARMPLVGKRGSLFRSLAARHTDIVRSLNFADRIMPSTRFLADVLARHGVESRRLRVTPYGIDVGALPPMVPIPDVFTAAAPLRVGFIGKLETAKGAHVMVQALTHLGDRRNDVQLDIYAALDPAEPYCKELMAAATPYGERVRFAGTFAPDQIGAVLRAMHVLVVPSIWYESIPLVLRSSLNAGVPAIVSEMGGLTEPLSGEMRRMSFTAGSGEGLAALLRNLLDDPSLLARLRAELAGKSRSLADYLDDVEGEYRVVCSGGL